MRKRLLLPAGLVIALLVPAIAYGASVGFKGTFPTDPNSHIAFHVKRVNGKNKVVKTLTVDHFNVNCTVSGPTEIGTNNPIQVNAAVNHRKWHFNDGTTNFQGKFAKHNRNKATGTLEVTLNNVDFGNGSEDCHGGPRAWKAKKV